IRYCSARRNSGKSVDTNVPLTERPSPPAEVLLVNLVTANPSVNTAGSSILGLLPKNIARLSVSQLTSSKAAGSVLRLRLPPQPPPGIPKLAGVIEPCTDELMIKVVPPLFCVCTPSYAIGKITSGLFWSLAAIKSRLYSDIRLYPASITLEA